MYDVTLGDWATEPFDLDINPYPKPFNCRYYPFPRINKETFQKELKRLVKLGVIIPVQKSQYITPVFIILNTECTMRFIKDYHRINQKLVRKPYPLPRIGETMQQLEGFQYAKALDLNMGYYTIRLSPVIQDTKKIVTEFGKFRYNRLSMGMCASGDISQAKVDKLLGNIKGVKMYIKDILILRKDSFEKHIEKLRIIFSRLSAVGLKCNAPKCIFGLKEIPYLGYVITREGIKPDLKKVQGIMDLVRPSTTT